MVLIYVMAVVVCAAVGVVIFLFYLINKESAEPKAVPITNLAEEGLQSASVMESPAGPSVLELGYQKKIEALEEELNAIAQKTASQAQETLGVIDVLTKENEALKNEQQKVQKQDGSLEQAQQEVEDLRRDNMVVQDQLQSSQAKLRELQEEMTALRQQMADELAQANAALTALQSVPQPVPVPVEELNALKAQNETLQHANEELQLTSQKLKELNTNLMEKSEMLQYELIKNRAQASGLERVSENYKTQVEKLLDDMNHIAADKTQLAQTKNRLEGDLVQMQQRNEELIKREKLSQFELGKLRNNQGQEQSN